MIAHQSFLDGKVVLWPGDCLDVLDGFEADSFDSVVTDPPYHLTSMAKARPDLIGKDNQFARRQAVSGFMSKAWDGGDIAFQPATWAAVLRVLKPGGHMVAFSGTRTYHRMVCAIEDAGFEIRDQMGWAFGSGFPKSHDVSKGIDRAAGAERDVVGIDESKLRPNRINRGLVNSAGSGGFQSDNGATITAPSTDAAREWQGWGTALKPAYEPVCLAQKPYEPQQVLAILVPTIGELICKVASFAKTDMRLSELLQACGFWSTATSLRNFLGVLSGVESKFTTETAIALTTDLKILKSLLSRITQGTTTQDETQPHGAASNASLAAAISRSVIAKCERLASTTAGEIVIDWLAEEGGGPGGSRLTPLWSPICLARKPLGEKSIAANVLKHGTGAINIDACRVGTEGGTAKANPVPESKTVTALGNGLNGGGVKSIDAGRWPANLIHDGSEEVLAAFPDAPGQQRSTGPEFERHAEVYGKFAGVTAHEPRDDAGSAARFFYTAKADSEDRLGSKHPTVKPLDLMQYLCRLVTPPGGTVLDPFAGTGTTGEAAWREGFKAVLIEREAEYQADIARRMDLALKPAKRAAVAKSKNNLRGAEGTPLFT